MSKRCELQKEYYQAKGNYKGNGKYNDDYVRWLEDQILALRIHDVVGRSEQLKAFIHFAEYAKNEYSLHIPLNLMKEYVKSL
jgi:hypothetical protein